MGVVSKKDYRKKYLSKTVFDDGAKGVALDMFAKTGRVTDAAMVAGVSTSTVRSHLERDPEFAQAWEIARQEYADYVTSLIEERAFKGVEEPIIGGKFRDQVVAHKRVFSDSLAMMHAKRYVEEYREKQQLDVSVAGGVLAVASPMPNSPKGLKEWKSLYAGEYEPGSIKPESPPRMVEKQDERQVEGSGEQRSGCGSAVPSERPTVPESEDWGAVGERASAFGEEARPLSGGEHPDAGVDPGDGA